MPSPIDDLYEKIFGAAPNKAGTAFERLAAIATFVTEANGDVTHDAALRGAFSGSRYQIDVLHQSPDAKSMGEAKDYTDRGGKVGRPDLQKLAGALLDLPDVEKGVFWSATGYTKPAQQYAEAASFMAGKEILLRGLRESTPVDEEGFVKTIRINGTYHIAQLDKAIWKAHWTPKGRASLIELIPEGENELKLEWKLEEILSATGEKLVSVSELTSTLGYGTISEDGLSRGCYWLPQHYIEVNGNLVSICGIEFEVPYETHRTTFEITDNSTYRLVILDETGAPVKILTDEKIREFSFDLEGQLVPPQRLNNQAKS
ncbi:restriction endonuclease [Pseudomonas japonica]|uniref:restriction endonuclease n=1 Tax=Pseudomonas japonica TaxID=256466 RepID=UPI003A893B5A